jgi:hypothetical protein
LINNTIYLFNISNCDSSGKCAYFISNFTTSLLVLDEGETEDEEDDVSVYSVSYSSLVSGYEKQNLISGDLFSISRNSGEKYNLTIVSIGSSSIRLRVNNLASFLINSGNNQLIDTNSDNINDLEISVLNISQGKARIKLKYYNQQSYNTNGVTSGVNGSDQETPNLEEDGEGSLKYIIFGLIVIFILVIAVLLYFKKKEIINYFSPKSKVPSQVYSRIWGLVHQAESLIHQGRKDQAKSVYVLIRNLYPSLRNEEKNSLKPRLLRLYSYLK